MAALVEIRIEKAKCLECSMLSPSPMLPVQPPMGTMAPVIHPQNVLPREELLLEHVLHLLESAVSLPFPVGAVAVPTTPMPSSLPFLPALMLTPVPTHSVKPIQMSVS